MGRKPEDAVMPLDVTPQKLFTMTREEGPGGITLTAIWTGLQEDDFAALAPQVEGLVQFDEDDFNPWDGGGAGHDFN